MADASFRELTALETELVLRLLSQDFPGRPELVEQLANCSVRVIDENGSLEIQSDSPNKALTVISRVPTEGEAEDADGITIHFLLHVVNGTVTELEVYKEDNSPVLKWPSADVVRVFVSA